ncbi:MAG TPA: efflux RND transporter permease subunit, partial [candidate division Zixibacteria bacterium]|nr:efflux RND transporter permease subunit [candidate division Zixibacteria bacterium]
MKQLPLNTKHFSFVTISSIKMEIFPEFEADLIVVSVPYLGAAPAEVEVGVCVRIEEAIQDLEGIKKLSSTASEGVGTISIEVESGFDGRRLLEDVKSRVDAISTFPEETEKPIIREIIFRRQVINVAVSGNADEATLKILTEQIREDILAQTAVSQVQLASVRPYEISIEVSEFALRRYGLTFSEVVQAVRNS